MIRQRSPRLRSWSTCLHRSKSWKDVRLRHLHQLPRRPKMKDSQDKVTSTAHRPRHRPVDRRPARRQRRRWGAAEKIRTRIRPPTRTSCHRGRRHRCPDVHHFLAAAVVVASCPQLVPFRASWNPWNRWRLYRGWREKHLSKSTSRREARGTRRLLMRRPRSRPVTRSLRRGRKPRGVSR